MTKESIRKFTKRNLPAEVRLAVKAAQARKGEEICVLDLRDVSSFTDFFVIMHGNSSRQNIALYEGVEEELKRTGVRPLSVEGKENAEWILMDYGDFLVHVFTRRSRDYYSLDKLWGDAPRVQY
ncbi:MAG: ribosome silencing factor [Candidatus Aminicenantes bacterium]|jgi:ribosome-associated protein|nr:ribosome silencing factor [Candidatus Aminicenantes bacterium]